VNLVYTSENDKTLEGVCTVHHGHGISNFVPSPPQKRKRTRLTATATTTKIFTLLVIATLATSAGICSFCDRSNGMGIYNWIDQSPRTTSKTYRRVSLTLKKRSGMRVNTTCDLKVLADITVGKKHAGSNAFPNEGKVIPSDRPHGNRLDRTTVLSQQPCYYEPNPEAEGWAFFPNKTKLE
jgi:hypothetical protein